MEDGELQQLEDKMRSTYIGTQFSLGLQVRTNLPCTRDDEDETAII